MIWDVSNDENVPIVLVPDDGNSLSFGESIVGGETYTGWKYSGEVADPDGGWSLTWTMVYSDTAVGGIASGDVLAFVVAEMTVNNNFPFTATYDLTVTLPVIPSIANPLIRGRATADLTDTTGNGATLSAPAGSQVYTPFIDGRAQAVGILGADPFSLTANPNNSISANFGLPNGTLADQSADQTMGVRLHFDLTPGARAKVTGLLEIVVPGPGGLPLLAVFGLLAGRRRRA